MFQKAHDPAHTSHSNSTEVLETVWDDKEEEYTREEMKEMTHFSGEGAKKEKQGPSLQSLHKRTVNDGG